MLLHLFAPVYGRPCLCKSMSFKMTKNKTFCYHEKYVVRAFFDRCECLFRSRTSPRSACAYIFATEDILDQCHPISTVISTTVLLSTVVDISAPR